MSQTARELRAVGGHFFMPFLVDFEGIAGFFRFGAGRFRQF